MPSSNKSSSLKCLFMSFALIYVVLDMAKLRDERETIFKAFVGSNTCLQNS